jgi:competence protein ComGC
MERERGFTLVELILVLTGIALVTVVAVPALLTSRLAANETAAVATLREIAIAEAQFKAAPQVDLDRDGRGEFGFLKELSAATGVRRSANGPRVGGCAAPAPLPARYRAVNSHGELARSGYLFRVFLPGRRGVGVGEQELFPVHDAVDADLAATTWCCYAWPVRHATSGDRTFLVHAGGDVVETDCARYDGVEAFDDRCGAAFVPDDGPAASIAGAVADGARGRDGNLWKRTE